MVDAEKVWSGKVDRISGSGNAMVSKISTKYLDRTKSRLNVREVNLGPLPSDIVGETVPFYYDSGTFGLCIDIRYIDKEYLEVMAERQGFNSLKIKPGDLSPNTGIPDPVNSGDILFAESLFPTNLDEPVVDMPDGQYLTRVSPTDNDNWSCIGVIEEPFIQNDFPVPVTVADIHPTYIEVQSALPKIEDDLPDIGETVTTTTGPQHERGTLALYEAEYAIPVLLENVEYPIGDKLNVEVTDIKNTIIIGEAAFSAEDLDIIHVDDGEVTQEKLESRNRIIKQGVPVDIEPVPADATTTTGVVVTDEGTDALTGRWNIQKEIGSVDITEGDEIDLDICAVLDNSCIGYYERFPVRVEFSTSIPSELEGECLSVSIRAFHPDKAIAEPTWIKEPQGELEVRIVGIVGDDAIAIKDRHLLRIPKTSVVKPGDHLKVAASEPVDNNILNATVSARPVFQNSAGPHIVRLPRTQGDVVQVSGTPVVVDHLPDLETNVTLGVAEVNEDHIVPTITALPEAHLPGEGSHILARPEETVNNTVVAVGEELPLKLPLFLPAQDEGITARILDRRTESLFAIVGGRGDDTSGRLLRAYEQLQLAALALQQKDYQDAAEHLNNTSQSCPSEFPVFERLLAVQEGVIQAIRTIHNSADFGETAHLLSQEADRLHEFEDQEMSTADIDILLSAHEAEMRAAEQLLTALDEVDHDITSNLQAIAQGVSAKTPAVKAAEHLQTAEDFVAGTLFEDQIPSLGIRIIVQEFDKKFPGIVDELPQFDAPRDDADWFRHLVPEWIIDRTDPMLSMTETDAGTWQRPAVPESTGIFSITDVPSDDDSLISHSTATQNKSKPDEYFGVEESDESSSVVSKPRQTEVEGKQEAATDEELPAAKLEQTQAITEEETPEQRTATEASPNELSVEDKTDEQSSATEDTTEDMTQTTSEVESSSSTAENEASQLEASDESLSVPDDSATLRRLRKRAEAEATEDPKREHVETTTSRYQRSSAVREYALKRADGICELCEEAAPFMKENGDPFLEVHHVDELGEGGADHPSLVGAICPNCHREIHYGKHGDDLNKQLRRRLENGLGDVGAVDD